MSVTHAPGWSRPMLGLVPGLFLLDFLWRPLFRKRAILEELRFLFFSSMSIVIVISTFVIGIMTMSVVGMGSEPWSSIDLVTVVAGVVVLLLIVASPKVGLDCSSRGKLALSFRRRLILLVWLASFPMAVSVALWLFQSDYHRLVVGIAEMSMCTIVSSPTRFTVARYQRRLTSRACDLSLWNAIAVPGEASNGIPS